MVAKLVPQKRRLRGLISKAFNTTARQVHDQARVNTESAIYSWPNETRRENGQVASSPRNIVDLGRFRDEQRLTIQNFTATTTFYSPYAPQVIFGFTRVSGTVYPGRNPYPKKDQIHEIWQGNIRRLGGVK